MIINQSLISAITCNIISFAGGAALTWSSPTVPKLTTENTFGHEVTDDESSWISSLLALGATFGPFLFGFAADRIGRKYTLLAAAVPFIAAGLLFAFGDAPEMFYAGRILTGLAVGGSYTVIPMYIGEIATANNRGALSSIMNVCICSGLLFSYCVGPFISILAFNLVLTCIPILFLVTFFLFGVESPTYLLGKDRVNDAKDVLLKLRYNNATEVSGELEVTKEAVQRAQSGSVWDLFRSRALIKAFCISLALVAFQQLSGINVVLFNTQLIFHKTKSSLPDDVSAIVIGSVQFITSFVTPIFSDRLGRKILLIFSGIGMAVSEIPLGIFFYLMNTNGEDSVTSIGWLPILSLIVYIFTYNCGFGPLPWVVMGELFPSNVKSAASSLTACFCWFLGFIITKFFNNVSDAIGLGESFWMFAGFCVLSAIFTIIFVIETKGKSLEEIQDVLNGKTQ